LTKKGRTILTSFAGSIGIIGIALILSLSQGVDLYIERVQKDTLSTYPVTITETTVDTNALIMALMNENNNEEHGLDKVYSNDIMLQMIETMSSKVQTNNLEAFKKYIEQNNEIKNYVSAIQYGYNLQLQIFKNDNTVTKVNPSNILDMMMMGTNTQMSGMMGSVNIWEQMIDNPTLLQSQYDLVKGNWPKNKDEVVLIVDENNEISDFALYSLGLKDQSELIEIMSKLMKGEKVESVRSSFEFDDLLNTTYKAILNTDYYQKQGSTWIDMSNNREYMNEVIKNGLTIKIVGIIRPNEEATATSMTGSIGYLSSLIDYLSEEINQTQIVKEQLNHPEINVFTGSAFQNTESYEMNLITLGIIDKDEPSSINFYANNLDDKEKVIDFISTYNDKVTKEGYEENVINYSDVVGAMMDGVSSIVNTISYVLIAFVTISLVVSSIMIGIITYISVLERTKEIGILRAIGASKKDISRVFNAETMIVGLVAGGIGILATLGLNVIANIVIKSLTGISNLASLPLGGAIILIIISTLLTLIAGLIPSRYASKKDPVEALRTE
ncbi:MAG: ABC transporter permease, partial [Bacilli bacterium]|nr:ABC transporter permease [Bacilli bacterium]